jgi:hypothetical protein
MLSGLKLSRIEVVASIEVEEEEEGKGEEGVGEEEKQ